MMAAEKMVRLLHAADLLWQAVCTLARVCDGAKSEDGHGFNKFDAKRGHQLAGENPVEWNAQKCRSVRGMLTKYRRQLEDHGIDLDSIQLDADTFIMLDTDGETFLFRFPYAPEMTMHLKRSWGTRCWDPKARVWRVKVDEINASRIFSFATKWGIPITPDAERRARQLEDALAQTRTRGKKTDPRQRDLFDRPEPGRPQEVGVGWSARGAQDLFK